MLLSICIPSHDRFDNLLSIVNSLLSCNSNDFNIIISDNGSSKDICEIIPANNKVTIIKKDVPVSGQQNILDVLSCSNSEYSMLCLDKDFIDGNKLELFLECIKKRNYAGGFCFHNVDIAKSNLLLSRNNFFKWTYRSRHPSGMFFKTNIIKEEIIRNEYNVPNTTYYNNAFQPDMLLASCFARGPLLFYRDKLVSTESKEDCAKTVSYTYLSNIYFSPLNRVNQYCIYIQHLKSLGISNSMKRKTVYELFDLTLIQATFTYSFFMKDRYLCAHHGLKTCDISNDDLKKIFYESRDKMLQANMNNLLSLNLLPDFYFKISSSILFYKKFLRRNIKRILGVKKI